MHRTATACRSGGARLRAVSEQEQLYEASAQGVEAVAALAQRWDHAQRERVGHAVRVRIIDEMNTQARATSELRIDAEPFLRRLDALRRAGVSPA